MRTKENTQTRGGTFFYTVEDALEASTTQKSPVKKLMLLIARILEWYIGVPLRVLVPHAIASLPVSLPTATLVHKLITLRIIEGMVFSKKPFGDEPPLYSCSETRGRAAGADLSSYETACLRALSEAVERYFWKETDVSYNNEGVTASYKHLKEEALNVFRLAGFSEDQRLAHKELQFDEVTPFRWTKGHSLTTRRVIWCPTQLISAHYYARTAEPRLRWCVSTGLATHASREAALLAGILEAIERDAFMITWLNRLSPPHMDLEELASKDTLFQRTLTSLARYKLTLHVVELPTDFPIPAYCAVLIDQTSHGPKVTVGASARFSPREALEQAVTEALLSRTYIRGQAHGWQDISSMSSDNFGREERLLYWATRKDASPIDFLISGKKKSLGAKVADSYVTPTKQLELLINLCKQRGYEIAYVPLTLKTFSLETGLESVAVIIPELQPLHLEERIPYLGGERLHTVPKQLGYQPAEEMNREPHPFP